MRNPKDEQMKALKRAIEAVEALGFEKQKWVVDSFYKWFLASKATRDKKKSLSQEVKS